MPMNTMLGVNEVFETIQGEATFTGTPAVFLRLQGCGVGCPWCDTKHTWAVDEANEVSLAEIVAKTADAPTYARATAGQLIEHLCGYRARHIVITGGEPCTYDLVALTSGLLERGRNVQIETSGTSPVRVARSAWVTLSPKIGMPGGLRVRQDAVDRADEIKMPVGKPDDIKNLLAFSDEYNVARSAIWVQPLSRSPKATELCIEAATKNGWRVSIQTHQFIGVR